MSVSTTGVREIALALLTTMSRPPNVSTVRSIASLTCASSRTSTVSGSGWPPALAISSAAVKMVPGNFGCGLSVLAAMAMLAPSRAARSAIASPMPREAPVMKRVLFLSDMGFFRKLRPGAEDASLDDASSAARREKVVFPQSRDFLRDLRGFRAHFDHFGANRRKIVQ